MKIIERVIWPEDTGESATVKRRRGQPIDEIEHPSVGGHHFYAMSVYYYALDCMRQFGPDDFEFWPNPSLAELEAAALNFCSMNWPILKQSAQGANQHPYTLDTQLADRCFEVLYIITLLEKGFGFDREDRSITYALEVRNPYLTIAK
ncbi:hypothetical protein EON65_29995 [archaeon]|nr:MAG: hypothetical protein EON65_29995 [archaeon]